AGNEDDAAVDQRRHVAEAQDLRALDVEVLRDEHQADADDADGDGQGRGEDEAVAKALHRALRAQKLVKRLEGELSLLPEDGDDRVDVRQDKAGEDEPYKKDQKERLVDKGAVERKAPLFLLCHG